METLNHLFIHSDLASFLWNKVSSIFGLNLVRYLRSTLGNWPSWSSDYSCNLSHIGEKCTALDQTRNFIREEIS